MCAEHPLNTFVIRFWHRGAENRPGWVGQIWHVQSEKCSVFSDFAAMQDFIQAFGVELTGANFQIYLEAILRATDKVEVFAAGMNYRQFEGRLKSDRTYVDVKLRELWHVVKHDVPDLKNKIEQILFQK